MVKLSVAAEGLFGLTWPQWKRLVLTVEELGFHGLYLSDHFILPEPPDYPSLEMIVALTYLADHTERIRFGPRVSPLSFRDPVMLARQAAAIDDLSDGRMSLGLGAGWMEREHDMFGYDLSDIPERFDRFEEGLEVVTRLLRCKEPVSIEGRFFQLRDAVLPEPRRPGGPSIAIGGNGPKRTLPLVARFADSWNIESIAPDELAERSALLDQMILETGRQPGDVQRTLNTVIVCWRTSVELKDRLQTVRRFNSAWRELSDEHLIAGLRTWPTILGTPEEVIDQIRAYEAVGISEIEAKWSTADDIEGLEILAKEVLPHVA
jgi:alkanesulfonate monooxygenase SsuD/methylene tetrahydromethanopterin reductase-like flavin-dependent oxidoreductase (luciferase family)